jgi:hypothetical protein
MVLVRPVEFIAYVSRNEITSTVWGYIGMSNVKLVEEENED